MLNRWHCFSPATGNFFSFLPFFELIYLIIFTFCLPDLRGKLLKINLNSILIFHPYQIFTSIMPLHVKFSLVPGAFADCPRTRSVPPITKRHKSWPGICRWELLCSPCALHSTVKWLLLSLLHWSHSSCDHWWLLKSSGPLRSFPDTSLLKLWLY